MFRPIKIRHYLALMRERGFSAEQVLKGSQLGFEQLQASSCLVSLDQAKAVVSNMITLCDDQSIGFEVGRQTEMIDLGLVGHAMLSARTVREAVELWIRYSSVLVGMLIEVKFEEQAPREWSLSIVESSPLGFLFNFCAEESLMMMARLGAVISGVQVKVEQLALSYPAPAHHALYARHFDCPVRFNAPSTTIHFAWHYLDRPLRGGNDQAFKELCDRQCALILRQIGAVSPIVSRLRDQLLRKPGTIPGIEDVARELGMSGRTLRRHLQEEGFSFQQIVNDLRRDLALEYLRSGYTPKEIAYHLGFVDPNAFRRAFKVWTGQTIQQHRGDGAVSGQKVEAEHDRGGSEHPGVEHPA